MKVSLKGQKFSITQILCLVLYYGIAKHLPASYTPIMGGVSSAFRYHLVKRIFKNCGKHVNVEHGVIFGKGIDVEIGDFSGIGINAVIPSNSKIGNYVMMGPNCYALCKNHDFSRLDIPMVLQGYTPNEPLIIEDNVWIGRDVLMTPGRTIKEGSIVAAGCVLCKDFPEYSIIGGNPSRLIKSRKQ